MSKSINVLVVDPEAQTVTEQAITPELHSYQEIVGGYIEGFYAVGNLFHGHAMYLNEEGKLLPPPHHAWRLEGIDELLVGKAVLFRTVGSREGDARVMPEQLRSKITWLGAGVHPPERPIIYSL